MTTTLWTLQNERQAKKKLEILVYNLFTYQFIIFTAQWISLPVTEETVGALPSLYTDWLAN